MSFSIAYCYETTSSLLKVCLPTAAAVVAGRFALGVTDFAEILPGGCLKVLDRCCCCLEVPNCKREGRNYLEVDLEDGFFGVFEFAQPKRGAGELVAESKT